MKLNRSTPQTHWRNRCSAGARCLPLRPSVLRLFLASAAITAAVVIAGCDSEKIPNISGRHMQPLSEATLAELDTKNMAKESPILIRIFKEESELELWKVDKSGRFALLRSYPICRWSGDLGPKIEEGDRQAPEGFYAITPELMNPNSHYHLAINTGFPNAYDRANGRTGASLMIHGDCASVGCYAMTDEQIAEIYSLAREAFFGGQRSFQIQAYPFRMNPLNMARHRNSPHLAFWKVLKEGHDHFEVTRKEPKVAVCDKQYVFDAQSSGKFNPVDRCPAYKVPQQIASAVHNKQHRDEIETAQLISRGTPAASATTGGDGGMNPIFLSALRSHGGPGTAHSYRLRHHSGACQSSGRVLPARHERKRPCLRFSRTENPYRCAWPQPHRARAPSGRSSGTCSVPSMITQMRMCAKAR